MPDGNDSIDNTTDDGNIIGNNTENILDELIEEFDMAKRCLNETRIIKIYVVNFVRVLNIFFDMMPPTLANRFIIPYLYSFLNFLINPLLILNSWIERYKFLQHLYQQQ